MRALVLLTTLALIAPASFAQETASTEMPAVVCPVGYICLTDAEAIAEAQRVRDAEARVKACSAALAESRTNEGTTLGTIGKILFGVGLGIYAHQRITH
jgi:hypothetical protein